MVLEQFEKVTLNEMSEVAEKLLPHLKETHTLLFEGNLGSGKTTLTQYLLSSLGVKGLVSSPTFSIVNEYETGFGQNVFHFDCYRLKNVEEALAIGMDEYLDSGSFCLIEWPAVVDDIIFPPYLNVTIEHIDAAHRRIVLKEIIE